MGQNMCSERSEEKLKAATEAENIEIVLQHILGKPKVDVVKAFSEEFEKDLRRILGDRYRERPKKRRRILHLIS